MNSNEILHSNQELFTIVATGESGASLRGLSRMSGIPHQKLSVWFKNDLAGKSVPETLQSLRGKDLHLADSVTIRGGKTKPVKAFVAGKIVAYAAYALKIPQAIAIQDQLDAIGMESYIQGETGYLPSQYQESTLEARYQIQRLVKDANPWRQLYSKEVCDRVRSWYFPRNFFWKFAYNWMTPEEIAFLNEHNPVIEGIWQRRDRIFQFLSEETRDRLEPEIAALCLLIETSTSRSDFETRYARKSGLDQKELINA
jgi:hypothetical protein